MKSLTYTIPKGATRIKITWNKKTKKFDASFEYDKKSKTEDDAVQVKANEGIKTKLRKFLTGEDDDTYFNRDSEDDDEDDADDDSDDDEDDDEDGKDKD